MTTMPALLHPMLPTAAAEVPADESGWAYEVKFDGYRAIVTCTPEGVRIQSRNLKDMTAFYPELQALERAAGKRRVMLDAELVAPDEHGRPLFERLQSRTGLRFMRDGLEPAEPHTVPICLQIFDLLYLDGQPIMQRPYLERRQLLKELDLNGPHWTTPSSHPGPGGRELLAASREQGLEGLVAKRVDSRYTPGLRSPDWLKLKNWQRQEFVIAGWRTDSEGGGGWLGSLLLGYYDGQGRLIYVGGVEAGFTGEHLEALASLLPELATEQCPFSDHPRRKGEVWVRPDLIGRVDFLGWTQKDRLRHPVFRGFVLDRDPGEVGREA